MYLKIFLITQMACTSVCSGLIDISSCPAGPLWKYRAAVVCRVPEQYHCLYDSLNSDGENTIYLERCFPPKRYKGKRYVVSGYLDAEDCQKENYSPYPITSNVNTGAECPLKKSLCNEEGQVTVFDGSSSEDRTCRCNFEEGYRYINEPQNPCRCHPFFEDCSCYKDKCSLVTGNVCKQPTYFRVICDRPLNADIIEADVSESFNLQDNQESVQQNDKKTFKTVALILILAAICIGALSVIVAGQLKAVIGDTDTDKTQDTTNDTGGLENISGDRLTKSPELSCQAAKETNMIPIYKEIYREGMFVVEYFVPTVELSLIEEALLGEDSKRLVILEGMHGCGKKQTAYKFCNEYKDRYSFVCKLEFEHGFSFVDIVAKIPKKLQLEIPQEQKLESDAIIKLIKYYFKKKERDLFRCLLFLDKVDVENECHYIDIRKLLELRNEISNLDIIVATTNGSFAQNFRNQKYVSIVKFEEMREDEYVKFFTRFNVNDIKTLVGTIGSLPLVLYSASQYLEMTGINIPEYIQILESHRCNSQELKLFDKGVYAENAIASQITSLNYVRCQLEEKEWPLVWEILKYLKYLCYSSISDTVLEALYYHKDKERIWTKKKDGVNEAIMTLKNVCLCDVKKSRAGNEQRFLKFHKVTMRALRDITNKKHEDVVESDLTFLLKTFCYEIDIDATTDLTVERNLRFTEHAIKLLARIQKEKIPTDDSQLQFYQSYLHCAIGSTFLYQRTEINKARTHLMKAREIVLRLANGESKCRENADRTKIRLEVSDLYRKSSEMFRNDFIKEFVIEKRRNEKDVDVVCSNLPKGFKPDLVDLHYLSEKDYDELQNNGLALNEGEISKLFLTELLLQILHKHAVSLHELVHSSNTTDVEEYKRLCYSELLNSRTLCNSISNPQNPEGYSSASVQLHKMFVCLEIERYGTMLMDRYQMDRDRDERDSRQYLEIYVKKYETMIEACEENNKELIYFDFGVVKLSHKSCINHTAVCRGLLLYFLMKAYDKEIESEGRKKIYNKCLKVTTELENLLEDKDGESSKYCWLTRSRLYMRCGECLLMTECPEQQLRRALNCFEQAQTFESKREASLSRFTIQCYEKQIDCLKKLGRIEQAISVTKEAIKIYEGKNRNDIVDKFQNLHKSLDVDEQR